MQIALVVEGIPNEGGIRCVSLICICSAGRCKNMKTQLSLSVKNQKHCQSAKHVCLWPQRIEFMKREVLNSLFPESRYKSIRAKQVAQIDNAL